MIDLARERAYNTPLANSTLLPLMLLSLATQKNSPSPTQTPSTIYPEYDVIVVGAGSAGSTVASRLSEFPDLNVLLLEAGTTPPILNEIPALGRNFWFTDIDWQYKTTPQKHTGRLLKNRQVVWPSGKGLGGSSLLNAMLYVRGNRKNYDDWAAQGATGWSYQDVLPYFMKLEDNRDFEYVANGYHGVGGPITVEKPRYHPEIKDPIFEAAQNLGYEVLDPNGVRQTGFYDLQGTLRQNQRCSTAKAYLVPAESRPNLDILPNAFVNKVIIENRTAVGVSFEVNGRLYEVRAKREVIMSAGTTNTAQLLMLSGIGPREELQKHGIPTVANLPVGENLQEHGAVLLPFELDSTIPNVKEKLASYRNTIEYILNRSGPYSSTEFCSVMAFLNGRSARPVVDDPNFELYFVEITKEIPKFQIGLTDSAYNQIFSPYENKPIYVCLSSYLQPKSRGYVRLQSSNARDPPLINPNYFDDPSDLSDVVQGMKACQKIATSEAMQKLGSRPFNTTVPGCEQFSKSEDDLFECIARSIILTLNHQVSTAKMGDPTDPTTVVDPRLRVKGIKNLRVVDASIMPIIPSGNTNIPTIMVAEKASDIIKEDLLAGPEMSPFF